MREASSRRLLQQLWDAGAKVRAYDPEAMDETSGSSANAATGAVRRRRGGD